MPTVRYTGGGHYRVGGEGFDPGQAKDVDAELAAYLEDVDGFEVVDEAGDEAEGGDETFTCAGSTADGDPCTREVDEQGGYCHQHGEA